MKKNKVFTSALVATLLMSGAGATSVFAANGVDTTNTQKGNTNATITFDSTTKEPISPLVPAPYEPVKPTDALTFVYVTDSIGFGKHTAGINTDFAGETGDNGYKLDTTTGKTIVDEALGNDNFFMQVADTRSGAEAQGWTVSGQMVSTDADSNPIDGITLTLPTSAEVITNQVNDPTKAIYGGSKNITLGGKEATADVFYAAKGSGQGIWGFNSKVTDMKLTVPTAVQNAQTDKKTITNKITWQLTSSEQS